MFSDDLKQLKGKKQAKKKKYFERHAAFFPELFIHGQDPQNHHRDVVFVLLLW